VHPDFVGVEEGAFKQAATRDLIRRVQQLLAREHQVAVGVRTVKPSGDKTMRAQLPAGRAQSGLLFTDRRADWWAILEGELLGFPKAAHDDCVDALSGAVQLLIENAPREEIPSRTYSVGGASTPTQSPVRRLLGGGIDPRLPLAEQQRLAEERREQQLALTK
jgi:hypothetical protein